MPFARGGDENQVAVGFLEVDCESSGSEVDNIRVAFPMIFRRIGMRRYSLYLHPLMARDLFDLWNIARLRRIEFNHWELVPRPILEHNGSPTPRMFRAVVARNLGCVRRH